MSESIYPFHSSLSISPIATLVDGQLTAGTHTVNWKGDVASGIYFYRLTAQGLDESSLYMATRKMVLMR